MSIQSLLFSAIAGRVTTVVATAVTNQGAPPLDAPPRPGRSKGRGAAAKGPPKAPALRGRPSRTGDMAAFSNSVLMALHVGQAVQFEH